MSESESGASTPSAPQSSEESRKRYRRRFGGSLRDTLIAGIALVVGAALGFAGTAYSAQTQSQSERTLAHNGDVRNACSAYTAILISSANVAMDMTSQMRLTGGWTR